MPGPCDVHTPARGRRGYRSGGGRAGPGAGGPLQRRYAAVDVHVKDHHGTLGLPGPPSSPALVSVLASRPVPTVHCRQCITNENRPVARSASAALKGNLAWRITRAYHLAGRCVGCDECHRTVRPASTYKLNTYGQRRQRKLRLSGRHGPRCGAADRLVQRPGPREKFIR